MVPTDRLTLLLLFLAGENKLKKFLKYTTPERLEREAHDGYAGLSWAIVWKDTDEGFEYWARLNEKFADYCRRYQ